MTGSSGESDGELGLDSLVEKEIIGNEGEDEEELEEGMDLGDGGRCKYYLTCNGEIKKKNVLAVEGEKKECVLKIKMINDVEIGQWGRSKNLLENNWKRRELRELNFEG